MDLLVARDDLRTWRYDGTPTPDPGPGEARLRITSFALTANNITYAVFGDAMAYWQFFPAEARWGRIPVWGFATVEASTVDGLAPGEGVYGYFPIASHLIVTVDRLEPTGFVDGAAHRAPLPPVYNHYTRLGTVERSADADAYEALLRPLFSTSFLLDDWLSANNRFGAPRVVIGSASSKTALGLAYLLAGREDCRVVGLTSPGNTEFVSRVGYYDSVASYADIDDVQPDIATVFVDMAGDATVTSRVHHRLAKHLTHSCQVGATHWEDMSAAIGTAAPGLPGPVPTLFFAPSQGEQRAAQWGRDVLEARIEATLAEFVISARQWLEIVHEHGEEAVAAAYVGTLEGRARPDRGYILSL